MHKLLQRQLKRYIGDDVAIPETWQAFLEAVNAAYEQADADYALLEHSLELASEELIERNTQLRKDIAERQRAEIALRKEEERFRYVALATRDAIYDWDLPTGTVWRNEAYQALYSPDEPIGTDETWWEAHIHPDDRQRVVDSIKEGFRTQLRFWSGEYRFRRFDDTYAAVIDRGYILYDPAGVPTRMIGAITDITDRKQAETALIEAKERAETADRTKSAFLANMSHEIRTPLNGIIGMTELLADTPLRPEQHESVHIIRTSGEALLRLIHDILDFSKIEAGHVDLEKRPFSVRDAIEDTLDVLALQATEKHLDLVYHLADDVPAEIVTDDVRFKQVLLNLVANAVKFTHEGDVFLSVTAEPEDDEQYRLHVAVRDTGIGIPADRLDRLFKSFSQVDASMSRKYGGTGLGLAISKRLVETMGGTIWVESDVGTGSTFHFTITTPAGPTAPPAFLHEQPPCLVDRFLLIVDDNATSRRMLARQAERWGMKPTGAATAAEALALLDGEQRFDLALVDRHLPGMDGFALASAIHGHAHRADLLLVLLSPFDEQHEALPEEDHLFQSRLSKPVKMRRLYETLIKALSDSAPTDIELPASYLPGPPPPHPRHRIPSADEAAPCRILLVEDNLVNQKVALRLLARFQHEADVASDGAQALAAVEQAAAASRPYHLIFMDAQMPVMDGIECTRCIRRRLPAAHQPWIIALTANALAGDRERFLRIGMDDYLTKPIKSHTLKKALQHGLAQWQAPARNSSPHSHG